MRSLGAAGCRCGRGRASTGASLHVAALQRLLHRLLGLLLTVVRALLHHAGGAG